MSKQNSTKLTEVQSASSEVKESSGSHDSKYKTPEDQARGSDESKHSEKPVPASKPALLDEKTQKTISKSHFHYLI